MPQAPETPIAEPKLSLLAKLLGFLVFPLLLLLGAFEAFQLFQPAFTNGTADTLLMVLGIFLALVICGSITTYHLAHFHSELQHLSKETGLNRRARYHEDLLRVITDNIPNSLFITDREGHFWFANNEAGKQVKMDQEDLVGKTVDRVFLPRQASLLIDRIKRANKSGAPVITVDRRDEASGPHYMQTYHIPLPDTADLHNLIMVTQKDITDVIVERERQDQTFRQLIDTLVAVVDRRDPYAAGHSLRVGMVAEALALEMGLDESSVETCRIAGSLMNLGKVLVPRKILVKSSALDAEELRLVRKSILTSADILSLISFQVPVIPTLRQVLERYDGSGMPEGRKGENILETTRIVVVANAFVALVSPRAHRQGLTIDNSMRILKEDNAAIYDPKIVAVLGKYLESYPDASQSLLTPPPELRSGITDKDFLND
ncbi:MAG: PAS domain-containing protein [Alphaproteobacteria bacterium]|nr:PAS domain-containing protein [Alphaproteobacteria bacterium]